MRQRLISRQPAIPSTKGRGGGSARCGQCLETKARENPGGSDIPWIRNYENARAVVKRPEPSGLFILGDTHRITSRSILLPQRALCVYFEWRRPKRSYNEQRQSQI